MNRFLFIFALIIWNELPAQSTAGVILEKHIYQLEKAVIADPDGWSNLRESPEGRILDTFYNHELIYVYADTLKNWYAVRNSIGKEGFIHKGRIRLIKLFSPDELKSFCNRIISGYLELHLLEKMENESCGLLSDYYFNRLTYSFDIISKTICKVWDAPLFQNFIDVLRLESGSASEAQLTAAAEIYACHPDEVLEILKGKNDRELNRYFKNSFGYLFRSEHENLENYEALKQRLETELE